jgi:transposase
LDRHEPVDVLDDRPAETLAQWLAGRPGIEVISRDRASAYAQGARQGAPSAVQVADRFHLLKNLTDAVSGLLVARRAALKAAANAVEQASAAGEAASPEPNQASFAAPPGARPSRVEPEASSAPPNATQQPACPTKELAALAPQDERPGWRARQQREKTARRQRRVDRYQQVVELAAQGVGKPQIARRLRLSRNTVKRFLNAETFPERAEPKRASALDPFPPYLSERWEAGCRAARKLWDEPRALGFKGGLTRVRDVVAAWRGGQPGTRSQPASVASAFRPPSPRQARWLIVRALEELKAEERPLRAKILELCPDAATASALALDFISMVRKRQAELLEAWLDRAASSRLAELESFARGIERDKAAVLAALSREVSNGQTEGQVNRLKVIKRQMYGRAKLDLLRARVPHGPP